MARVKKSRKIGQIGTPSIAKESRKRKSPPEGKTKPSKGNKPGSRHSAGEKNSNNSGSITKKDPRIGSKKPIQLIVESKPTPSEKPKKAFFSPKEELQDIENDQKLSDLLDKIDDGLEITAEQQNYVETKLARHKSLCELLGVNEEEEIQPASPVKDPTEDDLFETFDTIDINKFK